MMPGTHREAMLEGQDVYRGPAAFNTLHINSQSDLAAEIGPMEDDQIAFMARYGFIANRRRCETAECDIWMSSRVHSY